MSATTRAAAPRTPPPAHAKRPARFPLYSEREAGQPGGPTEPPPDARLSETAIAPLGQPAAVVPEPGVLKTLSERVARTVASGDPTWLMSFGVLAGALLGVFILGVILVLV